MKTILVLGAGQFQIPVIQRSKELGYKTIVTDYDPKAEGLKFADIGLNISTLDKEKTLQAAMQYNVDGILTTSDLPVKTVAYVCKKMNLIGLSVKTSEICTDKFLLRQCMRENNIPYPTYLLIDNKQDIYSEKLKNIKFPLIIKPVDSSASRGVCKIDKLQELELAYEEAYKYSKSGKVIIEEFLEGAEYSVEILIQKGISNIVAITEKHTTGYPYFVEDRHIVSADITQEQEEQIKNMISKVLRAIKIDNSAAHAEVKITNKGPILIEIGARLGGDYITSHLVPLATGTNMLDNIINISVGKDIKISNDKKRYSGIQFITPKNYEKTMKNKQFIMNDDLIVDFYIEDTVNENLRSSLDRSGFYIVCTDSRKKLIETLDKYC